MSTVLRWTRQFASQYDKLLTKHPVPTKCTTGVVLAFSGDCLAQLIARYRETGQLKGFELDRKRTITFCFIGGVCSAFLFHHWYNWLDKLPVRLSKFASFSKMGKWGMLGTKLAFDQLLFSPTYLTFFFMSSNMTSDILYKIEKKALQYQASEPADSLSTLEKAISPELSVGRAVGDTELNMKDIYIHRMESPSPTEQMFLSVTPGRNREPELLPMDPDYSEDDTLRYLRDQYNIAKLKAKELNVKNDVSNMKPRTRKAASKLYSAVATVIYTTISSAKTSDVEKFIQKRATQIPHDYFDAPYWQEVLDIAGGVRGSRRLSLPALQDRAGDSISKDVVKAYFLEVQRRTKHLNAEHARYKTVVESEISAMQAEITETKHATDRKTNALLAKIAELQKVNEQLQHTIHAIANEDNPGSDTPDRMYSADELEHARRCSIMRLTEEYDRKRQEQLEEYLRMQRQAEESRKQTDLAIMEKHRQEFGALIFENKEKMKEMKANYELQMKNMTNTHNLQVEQLLAKIAMQELIPPVKDHGTICRDCDKSKGRIIELEANLDSQLRKNAELKDQLNSSKSSVVNEVMRMSSNISDAVLYSSFSNIEDVIEKTKMQKEIDQLKDAVKKGGKGDGRTKELLDTQLKINKGLLNQIDDLKFKLQMVDRSQTSACSEQERRDIIRKNSSLITMNYISGTIGKTVSSKIASKIEDLQAENDLLKDKLAQEQRVSAILGSQNTTLQLQELKNQLAAARKDNDKLIQQVAQLQVEVQKRSVIDDVSALSLEQARQQLNDEIRLNEELKAVNLSMQGQLINTTTEFTKLQFQHGLTSERIMALRQQIQDLEAQRYAQEKRMRDNAVVGTTASLRRQHSSHMASNIVVNAIASSVQRSVSLKSASFKQNLEAEEVAQLKKTIVDLQKQLTEQDMVYTEKMAAVQMALQNAEMKNEVEAAAKRMNEASANDKTSKDDLLYRQISAAALKTVNETVVASVLNSIDILSRVKSTELFVNDASIDAFDSHFSAELKNQGILVAATGTVQGNTGWYTIDGQFMYFCNINDEFVLMCGPLSESEHALANSHEKLSMNESTVEMNQQFGSVDKNIERSFLDPTDKVVVEMCAIRGNAIQRDRLLRMLQERDDPIDLVIPDIQRVDEPHISLHLSRDDDDTFTMASISVDESIHEAAEAKDANLEQQPRMMHASMDDKGTTPPERKAINQALSSINSSMFIKEGALSPASSVISFSQEGASARVSITDDEGSYISLPDIADDANRNDDSPDCKNSMPNIVTTVIIKMLRKEIKHLKELSIVDSQLISSLKARVYDDDSTMVSDTEYIKFMNKKLLSESNLAALYASESPSNLNRVHSAVSLLSQASPRDEDAGTMNSSRRHSASRHPVLDAVVEELGKESTKSDGNRLHSKPPRSPVKENFSSSDLMGVIKNLREEVAAYRGMLQDDSVIISALKHKLGLEDSDEIEIPGYIGVHSVRTSAPISMNTYTDEDDRRTGEEINDNALGGDFSPRQEGSATDGQFDEENVDLKHKVHILRNLLIQQGSQVRDLMKTLQNGDQGSSYPAPMKFATDQQADLDFEHSISKIGSLDVAKEELIKLYYANQDQLSVIKGYEIQVSSLQSELSHVCENFDKDKEKSAVALKECREDLAAARSSLLDVNNQLEQLKYRNELKQASVQSQLPVSSKQDDERYKMARLIQGRIRIFLAKRHVRTVRQMLAARAANVLFALKYTVQGETGWYAGPDGLLYYFVLDGDSWILACGPVQPDLYEEMILKCSMALEGTHKSMVGGNLHVRCNFELSNVGDNQDLRGDLFISAKTHKLFLSLPLDTVIISDGSRIISDGGGSRLTGSLVEDSNSLIQIGEGGSVINASTTLPSDPATDTA